MGSELISEGLTDGANRLQESVAGCLRAEYPTGNWRRQLGAGLEGSQQYAEKMGDQWGDRAAPSKVETPSSQCGFHLR